MRLAFLGTPEPAVPSLRALVDAGHDVAVVVTRPDRRRSRGGEPSPSAVKVAAQALGLSVRHSLGELEGFGVQRGVVVAYGALVSAALLERVPMLNVHFSLLPRWRGAAPVERAILAGDEETGVSVMTLEEQLDTGPVHLERRVAVGEKRAGALLAELAVLGAEALVEVLNSPELLWHPRPQAGDATYAKKLTADTYHLVPSMDPTTLLRTVRLERAFTVLNGRRLRVITAHQFEVDEGVSGSLLVLGGDVVLVGARGAIALDEVQAEGSRVMSASAWWAGARLDAAAATWS
jgi:methionyl-tRNA formyltransferase